MQSCGDVSFDGGWHSGPAKLIWSDLCRPMCCGAFVLYVICDL